ncbi:uncharacterized protein isoform X1 [Macaca fascicularis]|uniref:uncharacterized protein isoform X1 n=1 Tax=Macaca fascicularis TaxID=9541 RepID=UPI0032B0483A
MRFQLPHLAGRPGQGRRLLNPVRGLAPGSVLDAPPRTGRIGRVRDDGRTAPALCSQARLAPRCEEDQGDGTGWAPRYRTTCRAPGTGAWWTAGFSGVTGPSWHGGHLPARALLGRGRVGENQSCAPGLARGLPGPEVGPLCAGALRIPGCPCHARGRNFLQPHCLRVLVGPDFLSEHTTEAQEPCRPQARAQGAQRAMLMAQGALAILVAQGAMLAVQERRVLRAAEVLRASRQQGPQGQKGSQGQEEASLVGHVAARLHG